MLFDGELTGGECDEVCDGIDNDGDGDIDEGFDVDGDGYTTCDGDCDDGDAAINPGASEACDGVDEDCNGIVDDGFDADGDGFNLCDGDCDDDDDDSYPGADELCDGLDNDCDGEVPWEEVDFDGDGQTNCEGDCNESDAGIYAGAPELCDGIDSDCDGSWDSEFDDDGDGILDCIDVCPMVIDFDNDPWGDPLAPGIDATDTYAQWGINIERYDDGSLDDAVPAITWDSSNPGPGEEEMGTPNVDFGGPGVGDGGAAGEAGENWREHENVMKTTAGNTWYIVEFTSQTCVHAIQLIDVDEDELAAQVILFDVNLQTIDTVTSQGLGDNSVETMNLGGVCGVYAIMIDFYGQGAWDNLVVCVDPAGTEEVCDDGIDNDGDGYVDEDDLNCADFGDDDDSAEEEDDYDGTPDCSLGGHRASAQLFSLLFGLLLALPTLRRRR